MGKKSRVIFAVDLGSKNIGLAIYQPELGSRPLPAFRYKDVFELEEKLERYIQEYPVQILLVGDLGKKSLPKQLKDILQKIAERNKAAIKVIPEKLTSFQAEKEFREQGIKEDFPVHSQAALLMLQDYLDL